MSEWTGEEPRQVGASGAPAPWQSAWAHSLPSQTQGYDPQGYDPQGYDPGHHNGHNGHNDDGYYGYEDEAAGSWDREYTYEDVDRWVATGDDATGYGYDEPRPGDDQRMVSPGEPDDGSGGELRRVLIGGAAGVAMLVGPIVLANVIVPADDDVQADDSEAIASRQSLREAQLEDQARADSVRQEPTTTTTLPPTTTTTAPPTTTTTAAPTTTTVAVEVPPVESGSGTLGDPYYMPTWDALADCEAGGNWQINTGNGYYGGLQFSLSSWEGVGGTGYPHENSRETQIAMGQRLWEGSGWGAWPACTRELGWR